MPNAVAGYWSFGDLARENANAFALFPRSWARDIGIVMMTIHQAVAFGLFAGPLFHMWEKLIHVHDRPFWQRSLLRLPLEGCMVVLAVAFPFFGAINAILGAFTTSFGTYIIPTVAFNLAFAGDREASMIKRPPDWVNLRWIKLFNWLVAAFVMGAGVGMGGYTSIKSFIAQINQFQYFADCYQC